MTIKELDVVRLKDGREGTVLEMFDRGNMLYLEIPTNDDQLYCWEWIPVDQIEMVTYHS